MLQQKINSVQNLFGWVANEVNYITILPNILVYVSETTWVKFNIKGIIESETKESINSQ
jgi:hypothetical protein